MTTVHRFAYAEAQLLNQATNVEVLAAVSYDAGTMAWRLPESTDLHLVDIVQATQEGSKRWTLVAADGTSWSVRRTGGCGCRPPS